MSAPSSVRVDDEGIHLPGDFSGSGDVLFDDHHAWSFTADPEPGLDEVVVEWPKRMRSWLDGASWVRVVAAGAELFSGEVSFGSGQGRVAFVDKDGIPVMIDKWGLLQRPFSGRDRSVVEQMVEIAERIVEVMRSECGLEAWIAFGTLLGAAREGKVIGHDSDIDLAYLSDRGTPAEMVGELHDVARALRADGLRVVSKSGSFITVTFTAPDGGMSSIDIYTCFHFRGNLYETATVRTPVPRAAILPLTTMEFEGQPLPAPADPGRMLEVSYGPNWKVPDPSFRHEPGPEITDRFDDWFGSLYKHRRDWDRFLSDRAHQDDGSGPPSDFARWVADHLDPELRIIEIGAGNGTDAAHLARQERRVMCLDYARSALRRARRLARSGDLQLSVWEFNLYDLRDVLTRASLIAHSDVASGVCARDLLETLEPRGRDNLWSFLAMVLRGGGRALFEGEARSPADAAQWRSEFLGGRVFSVDPHDLADQARAAGATVLHEEGFAAAAAAVRGSPPARWRMIVEWAGEPDRRPDQDGSI